MKPSEVLFTGALAVTGCTKDPMQNAIDQNHDKYSDPLHEEECNPEAPCNIWDSYPFGIECTASENLKNIDPYMMRKLMTCATMEFPRTEDPEQDLCLRHRAVEGWLRENLVELVIEHSPAWDFNPQEKLKEPINIIDTAQEALKECLKRND